MENSAELRREKIYRIVMCVSLFLFYVAYMYTLDTVGMSLYIFKSYAPLLFLGLIGCGVYRGGYKKPRYLLGLLFVLWYIITRPILGDQFLVRSLITVMDLCVLYGLAFPFAHLTGDKKRRMLDILALVYVITVAVIAWLGVYYAVTGTGVYMKQSGEWYGMSPSLLRLQLLGQNPNFSAPLVCMGIFFTIYLLAAHWKKRWIAPAILALLGFYFALSLTDSRASILTFTLAMGLVGGVLAAKIQVKKMPLKAGVVALIVLVAMLISYKGIDLSKTLLTEISTAVQMPTEETVEEGEAENTGLQVTDRDITLDVNQMSGRSNIYRAVFQCIREHPSILLYGQYDSDIYTRVSELVGSDHPHVHNSFLQTLMLMGIPGLLFVLWLGIRLALATLKLLFSKAPVAEKLLPMIPVILLVGSLVESLVFVPYMALSWSLLNFFFLLISGYLMEAADQYSFREIFKKN